MSTTIASKTSEDLSKQSHQSHYQELKNKRETLEKALNNKYELLHMICQQEALLTLGNVDFKNPLNCQQSFISYNNQPPPSSSNHRNELKIKKQGFNIKALNDQQFQQYQNHGVKANKIFDASYMEADEDTNIQQNIDFKESCLNGERRNSVKSNSSFGLSKSNNFNASPLYGTSQAIFKNSGNSINFNHEETEIKFQNMIQWNEPQGNYSSQPNQILFTNKNARYSGNLNISTERASPDFQIIENPMQFSPSHFQTIPHQNHAFAYEVKHPSHIKVLNEFMRPSVVNVTRSSYNEDYKTRNLHRAQTISNHHSPGHHIANHTQGLGGYWTINNHNQRVWISDSVKYPSNPMLQSISKMSKKSNSLGNFDFIHNKSTGEKILAEGTLSNIQNENKKKNSWCETSLDDIVVEKRHELRRNHQRIVGSEITTNSNHPAKITYEDLQISSRLSPNISSKIQPECIYLNPLANNLYVPSSPPPIIPPKLNVKYIDTSKSNSSSLSPNITDAENNTIPLVNSLKLDSSPDSAKFTVVQEGSWKPYKEEVKSYEISDFYKYSVKYRQQQN